MSLNASLAPTEESAYGLHHAVVTAVNRLAPRYVRITFGGADLADRDLGGCSAADDDQVVMGHGNIPPSIGAKIARPTWRASRRVRRMPSRAVTEPSIRQASR